MRADRRPLPRLARTLAVSLLALGFAQLAAAQEDPANRARGLSATTAYLVGDIDSVNLYNGNLTISLPLGGSYPVGGALSYGLALHYNSGVWTLDGGMACPQFGQTSTVDANPDLFHDAGLGWRLSLGELYPPGTPPYNDSTAAWLYVGADGAKHAFYAPNLHNGEPTTPNVLYSRDDTYLRFNLAPAGLAAGSKTIEFPSGLVHTFDGSNRLVKIADRFGNALSVSYAVANEWDLSDTQGRTQRIVFRSAAPGLGQVDHVTVTAFGGGTATYSFAYADTTIDRDHYDTDGCRSKQVSVPLLQSVTLPDGSAYSMSYMLTVSFVNGTYTVPGTLTGLVLPTFGRYDYTYGSYSFRHPRSDATPQIWVSNSEGVLSKTATDVSGAVLGTWTYAQATRAGSSIDEQRTLVTSPLGHQTYHYFDDNGGDWTEGLPFSPDLIDATGTRNLSTEVYSGSAATGTRLRRTYYRYTNDSQASGFGSNNARIESERTLYDDDGGTTADVDYSGFDGLGHYRGAATSGTFPGNDSRTTFVDYNPGNGVYHWNLITNAPYPDDTFVPPAASAAWVLETSNFQWAAEAGNTAFTSTCYDATTGFLRRRRTHLANGSSDGTSDLIAAFADDGQGNVGTESYYGGDTQAVAVATGGANLCTIALPAAPVYQIQHTHPGGVLASSRYLSPATGQPLSFYSLDQTIDVPSGLVASSRDTAGLATTYSYDAMGRVTSVAPPGELATSYAYTRAAAGAAAAVDETTSLTHRQILFDGLGRVWRETELMPDFWNVRETLYDGAGNKASVSEVQTGNPVQKTQYLGYDPFGRPNRIRPADSVNGSHDVTMTYAGVRMVTRTASVATAAGVETAATTTELYDRQGRLAQVIEPSGVGGATVATTYGYDVGNRLATVSTTDATTSPSVTQTRAFAYDNRGLLTFEQHPEKGATGNGTVSYLKYDARGHAHRTLDGPHDLTYTYDAAERTVEIDETNGRPLKTFQFAAGNSGTDFAQGKLRTSARYNYPVLGGTTYTSQVGETYTYAGAGGRVSQRVLNHTFNGAASESFSQAFSWDNLGHVASLGYPQCTFAACSGVAASPRTVSFS
jgi:YD repeat-containing protein